MSRFKIKYISFLILLLVIFLISGCDSNLGGNTTSVSKENLQISNKTEEAIKAEENIKSAEASTEKTDISGTSNKAATEKSNLSVTMVTHIRKLWIS